MNRYKLSKQENTCIALIRDNELKNPAPFSNKKLFVMDDPNTLAEDPESRSTQSICTDFIEDVPIIKITGISITSHLDGFEYGMTFRDVLFNCLHGESLVQDSLDYFLSDCVKSDRHEFDPRFRDFPQNKEWQGTNAYGRRGVGLTKRGTKFFADQGQQRTIMAMFWIFQNIGINGAFKNVRVCKPA